MVNPTDDMSMSNRFFSGAGKAMVDLYRAGKQRLNIGDQAALQAEIDESRRFDAPLMDTGAGVVGNIVGNIAATAVPFGAVARGAMAVPALANAYTAAQAARPILTAAGVGAGTGATMGALEPTATGESVAGNMARGAAIGAAGGLILGAVSRVVQPNTAPAARQLLDEGVRVTPGRTLGGMASRIEQGIESVPVIGDVVKGSHRLAIDDFNRAAYNRALAPIGEKATLKTPVGHEGIAFVEGKLSNAYDAVLNRIGTVRLDNTFADDVGNVVRMARTGLDDASSARLERVIWSNIFERMTPAGTMSAQTMKQVESELGRLARGLGRSEKFDDRQLSAAIREVQSSLRGATERAAPQFADELRAVNAGFANFVRIQNAASRLGSRDGVFSPSQLRGAVRANDNSVRKGASAKGEALMQDLADAGEKVLGRTVPDSGTPFRVFTALGAGNLAGLLEPTSLALGAAATLPYTRAGGHAARAAFALRPDEARRLAAILQAGAPAGAFTSGLLAPSLTGP